ncbi:Ecm40p [Saccharomyces cerevisiae VL3]|nr:Ecm40p [Saccharomyces cerevisiae VL3]
MQIVSLVLISPSTDIQLNERVVAKVSIFCNALLSIGRSVTMKPNKVAIFGQIIPAPFAIPVKVYSVPLGNLNLDVTNFGKVSVVQIDLATFNQELKSLPNFSSPKILLIPVLILSICSRCPITPVDMTRVEFFLTNFIVNQINHYLGIFHTKITCD